MTTHKRKQPQQQQQQLIVPSTTGIDKFLQDARLFCEEHPQLVGYSIFLFVLFLALVLAALLLPFAALSTSGSTSKAVTGPNEPLKIDNPLGGAWLLLGAAASSSHVDPTTEHLLTSTDTALFSSNHNYPSRCPSRLTTTLKITSALLKQNTFVVPAKASLILEKDKLTDAVYKEKYKQAIIAYKNTMVERILAYLNRYPERDYLRQVFAQESLLIMAVIEAPEKVERTGFLGKYSGEDNSLKIINPHTLSDEHFDQLVSHEGWHAYVALVRHKGVFPPYKKSLETYNQLSAPFKNKQEQALYQKAIDAANNRINEFDHLLNYDGATPLTVEQKSHLDSYIHALDEWEPVKHHYLYQATDENDMKNKLKAYRQGAKNITPEGNIPYRIFADNEKQTLIYYTSVKKVGPLTIKLSGDFAMPMTTSDEHLFKAKAFIAWRKFMNLHLIKNDNINYLLESDAHAIELSEPMQNTFYPELRSARNALSYCDFTEFETPTLSSERALVL